VDDNVSHLESLELNLKELDCQVFKAQRGLEALELVKENEFALFVIDIRLPGMDGYTLAQEFKKDSGTRYVPIIFITGAKAEDFEFFKGYDLGAFDFLMKPFQKQVIQSKVKVFLQLYEHQRSALRMVVLEKQKLELQKQKLELEKSNRDLVSFANVAAHDIKNPIHLVTSLIQYIMEDQENVISANSQECIEKVNHSCQRMLNMVDSILEFASVGDKQMTRVEFDLAQALKENVLEDLSFLIKEHQAKIDIKKLPLVEGSKELLLQLFQNLLSNAIKYRSANRTPEIVIESVHSIRRGDISISVSDNGMGMNEDALELIFQPFKRLVNQHQAEGSGIGLATVKKIVDAHFGSIKVESVPGKGTTFIVCLPKSSPEDDLRAEPRLPKLDQKSLKFYRLATELEPCDAMIIDESLNGFGCALDENRDIKIGDLLYLADGRHFEVCWLYHDEMGKTRFGLKLIPPV
jgi:signal transduction histidine kinase